MLRTEQYAAIIHLLKDVRDRPEEYLGQVQPILFQIFLNGFGLACRFMVDREGRHGTVRARTEAHRGWDTSQTAIFDCLKAARYADDAIIWELLTIEIETRMQEFVEDPQAESPAASDQAIIEDILAFYHYALGQPAVLTGTEMVIPLALLLSGFHLARVGLNVALDFPLFFKDVIVARGINPDVGVVESLSALGWNEASIHREVIAIERQTWQLKYAALMKQG